MRKILLFLLIVLIIVVAFFSWSYYGKSVSVEVTQVSRDLIRRVVPEDGFVKTKEEVNIFAEVNGKLQSLLIEEGDKVKAQQVIAELEKTYLAAMFQRAKAELAASKELVTELKSVYNKAKSDLARSQALAEEGAISKEQLQASEVALDVAQRKYESAKARKTAMQAALKVAKNQLEKATIRSPINGVVTLVDKKVGEVITTGILIARIINPATAYIEIEIPDSDIGEIKTGQKVRITADGCPGKEFEGSLIRIVAEAELKGKRIDVSTVGEDRIFRGIVEIENHPPALRPGMSLYADIVVEEEEDALIIPRKAVFLENGDFYTYVVNDGRARKQVIKVGIKSTEWVQISQGLNEGDSVVISGIEKLKDGRKVKNR